MSLFSDRLPDLWRNKNNWLENPFRQLSSVMQEFSPSCDVQETDAGYELSFDLPGLKKEDIKIDLSDNVLTVSGERKSESEEKKKGRYHSERFFGSFQRSFSLPANVKAEDIVANYEDGVLSIILPKSVSATKSHQIRIREKQQPQQSKSQSKVA